MSTFLLFWSVVGWIALVWFGLWCWHRFHQNQRRADGYVGVAPRRLVSPSPVGRLGHRAYLRSLAQRTGSADLADRISRRRLELVGPDRGSSSADDESGYVGTSLTFPKDAA